MLLAWLVIPVSLIFKVAQVILTSVMQNGGPVDQLESLVRSSGKNLTSSECSVSGILHVRMYVS